MITTSGSSRSAAATASSADAASAATTIPSSELSSADHAHAEHRVIVHHEDPQRRVPTPTGVGLVGHGATSTPIAGCGSRRGCRRARPRRGPLGDGERAAQALGPLAHRHQADAVAGVGGEAGAPVGHHDHQVPAVDRHAHQAGGGAPAWRCTLRTASDTMAYTPLATTGREQVEVGRQVQAHVQPVDRVALGQLAQRRGQAGSPRAGGSRPRARPRTSSTRTSTSAAMRVEQRRRGVRPGWRQLVAGGLQAEADAGQRRAEPVVQLAAQRPPLLVARLGQAAARPAQRPRRGREVDRGRPRPAPARRARRGRGRPGARRAGRSRPGGRSPPAGAPARPRWWARPVRRPGRGAHLCALPVPLPVPGVSAGVRRGRVVGRLPRARVVVGRAVTVGRLRVAVPMATEPRRSVSPMLATTPASRSSAPPAAPSGARPAGRRPAGPAPRRARGGPPAAAPRRGPAGTRRPPSAVASTSGASSLAEQRRQPGDHPTYATTTPAVSSDHTSARLTTRSSPHSRWRSTATSTAAGKNSCEDRCSTGVSHERQHLGHLDRSAPGAGRRGSAAWPRPPASRAPAAARRAVPASGGPRPRPPAGRGRRAAPICQRNTSMIEVAPRPRRGSGNGVTAGPSGQGYGSVTRASTMLAVRPAPRTTAIRARRSSGSSRTSHGTTAPEPACRAPRPTAGRTPAV